MNDLQEIRRDIENFLKEGTELFFNESELQMSLALFLRGKGYKVFLEYSIPLKTQKMQSYIMKWKKERRIPPFETKGLKADVDIVIEKEGYFYPIELKYKTKAEEKLLKRFGKYLGDSPILRNHGAQNIGRYSFWKDVARLEFIKECFEPKIKGGICVFVTNDDSYTKSKKDKFTMEKGKLHTGILKWDSKLAISKSHPKFSLKGNYKIHKWESTNYRGIKFHYCILIIR
jgi:hypothetical protein